VPLHHETFTHETPDGTLRAWDVTQAKRIARDGRTPMLFPLEEHGVTVEKVESLYEGIDREHALQADLSVPLIFVPLGEEALLLDGWHRLWKAAALGVPELPMFLLTKEEARSLQWAELPPGHGVDWR
jgi:hypothetical protein